MIDRKKDPAVYTIIREGRIEADWLADYPALDDRHAEIRRASQNRRHNTRTFGKMVGAPHYDDYDPGSYTRTDTKRQERTPKQEESLARWSGRKMREARIAEALRRPDS